MVIVYDDTLEELLRAHSEISESLSILHKYCHQYFNLVSNCVNVAVIVLSGIVGFLSALNLNWTHTNLVLGLISLLIGSIKSIEAYFSTQRRSSEHKLVFLAYLRIHKKLLTELALERKDRQPPEELVAIIKDNLTQLEEQAPIIIKRAILKFKGKYPDTQGNTLPPILNGLTRVRVNKSVLNSSPFEGGPQNISADIIQIPNE